jgi:hypothetical protein
MGKETGYRYGTGTSAQRGGEKSLPLRPAVFISNPAVETSDFQSESF